MKRLMLTFLTMLVLCVAAGFDEAWGWGEPQVVSTTPSNAAVNVNDATESIYVFFNESMDSGSFKDRITIDNGATIARWGYSEYMVLGVRVYQLKIDLAANLNYSTKYTVTLAKQISDDDNKQMLAAYKFAFTTMAKPLTDVTPPTVAATSPVSGAVDVGVSAPIAVTFSEVMDPATITTSNITVNNGVTGTVSLDAGGRVATFVPSSNLPQFTTFTVTVSTGVRDTAGNSLAANYVWDFRTVKSDVTPPTVTVVTPLNGATDVAVGTALVATFSEALDPATVTTSTFTVNNGVTGSVTYDASSFAARFTPSAPLAYGTTYTATITTGVTDLAANAMAQAKTWTFTTVRAPAQFSSNYYCQIPPFVTNSSTAVKPNVLLLVDNSGSMYEFAYKTPGTGNSSYDRSYNPSTNYYGYFDSNKMYEYVTSSGGFFRVDTSRAQDNGSFWSGNFLNWLTMRRIDIVRKVLVGGKTQPRSAGTANYLYAANSPDRDYYKSYNNVNYQIEEGTSTEVINDISNDRSYNVKIYVGDQPPQEGLILRYADKLNFGIMFFNTGHRYEDQRNSVKDGGYVAVDIGATGTNLLTQIENTDPSTWTPLGEAFYEATRYFQATTSAYNGGTYSGKDPILYPCQKNFVLILTDGEATKDRNIPGGNWNADGKVTDAAFDVRTYMDSIATQEGYASQWSSNANTDGGTYYLEGVAYWAHNTDLRSSTLGKSAIAGKQNLTTYAVFAFDDSPVGRDLLKKTAKYGGFDDYDNTGKPDRASKWDKNGDGVPDTFYEAQNGTALAQQLERAILDILARVSSGTAASILSNSEGSGANILQAVFYPRKAFEGSEVSWIGEMQNLWYYIDPRLNNSTVREDSDADKVLDLRQDKVARFRFENGQTVVDLLTDTDGNGSGDAASETVTPDDVKSLWRAGKLLHQRNTARTIYTHTNGTLLNFTSAAAFNPATAANQSLLQAANELEATKIINYAKGVDQTGYRSRTVTSGGVTGVWKLGDIISSTPRLQSFSRLNTYDSPPSAGYSDSSYRSFVNSNQYRNRGMVYVGANDGMLHAFKLGKLDVTPLGDRKARLTEENLGEEQWAFIPKNALPYLKYLADPSYNHLYYIDGPTLLLDASIGIPTGCAGDYSLCDKNISAVDSSNNLDLNKTSWRSILIGSMGLGGASRKTCASGANCVQTPIDDPSDPANKAVGYSSYFALDITDPANPSLLWEFSHEDLGYATTGPAIIRIGDRNKNGKWFAVVATGPTGPINTDTHQFLAKSDKPLKLFVLDLKTGALLRTIDATAAPYSFSDLSTAFAGSLLGAQTDADRWNIYSNGHYKDDALYFGYVKPDAGNWTQGGVMRLLTKENTDPAQWSISKVIDNTGPVTTAVARLTDRKSHNFWLYFGSGRYYFNGDDEGSRRSIYGVKEPCYVNTAEDRLNPTCSAAALARENLTDQTSDAATDALDAARNNGWFIDLDAVDATNKAERVVTDPVALTNGSVFFTSYKPTADPCGFGGSSLVWATKYNTGAAVPSRAMVGKIVLQLSTGSFEQVDIKSAFTARAGRRTAVPLPGKPPGDPPPVVTNANNKPVKKILHIQER
ncbi:Ig-like domain-containing protein [Geobacter sp. DSM 9736]|uniref:Ig-like domain-containing protein n=1 Tax=Geobacter sp. DSM 9736 TaxID=1277350 RepID=UPI000B505D20|nr:Ig-like domain-containing protein [Geobacter sp. DSM 9736]SNB46198.1 type IV pilus assembly protein PilY1 [Geobacter sp. DSM 9736]